MRHILFGADASKLTVALLIKDSSFNKAHILTQYVNPLVEAGISKDSIVAFTLKYGASKKVKAAYQKEYLDVLLPAIDELGIKVLYCTDTEYFKTLTKNRTAEPFHGCVVPCALNVSMDVVLGINYQAIFYNPLLKPKLEVSLKTLSDCLLNTHIEPGNNIIHLGLYPDSVDDIKASLENLHQYPMLTCDIEGFSLKFYNCGVGTISFAWDEHHGIAFAVDCGPEGNGAVVRDLIKEFLTSYKGTLIYHRAAFDIKVLVYQLWMKDLGDYAGMLDGIEILTRKFEDTLLIAYLATNNTVKNILGLKHLAQSFAGNWAQEEINDITLIPLDQLLEYNLKDCLATWFVFNKYYPKMVEDDQLHFYLNQMKPAVKLILQIELTGMPIDPVKVQEARAILEKIVGEHHAYLENSPIIKDFHNQQLEERVAYDNTKLKKKVRVLSDFADVKFNPGSDQQLQGLIYDYLGYEVIDTTDGGQPATGSKTLEKLINHAKTDVHKEIFEHLIGLAKADKILTSFIPAFEQAQQLPDGSYRLYGSFNQGGTQSGRLSSSDPNMQNIPSGSKYAKIIKACFISLFGWLFCGADFKALEAVCEALLSKDPNKLKVYIDGFDSHCVNTYAYFGDQMLDIDPNSVESINSIQDKYKPLRQKSKSPTFALQYQGTWRTIMKSAGLTEVVSRQVETNYHKLYEVSDTWIKGVLDAAHTDGFILGAFGLKIRTPILKQTVISKKMPYMATAERRSAGNAKTQSYGLLNTRAAVELQDRILKSPYRLDIMPSALIHDAIYMMVRNKPSAVKWLNDNLIECMCWCELPELQHDIVKLGAAMDIYWPHWGTALTLPNSITKEEIQALALEYKAKVNSPK